MARLQPVFVSKVEQRVDRIHLSASGSRLSLNYHVCQWTFQHHGLEAKVAFRHAFLQTKGRQLNVSWGLNTVLYHSIRRLLASALQCCVVKPSAM